MSKPGFSLFSALILSSFEGSFEDAAAAIFVLTLTAGEVALATPSLDLFFFFLPDCKPSFPSLFFSFFILVLILGDLGGLVEADDGEEGVVLMGVVLMGQMMLPESVSGSKNRMKQTLPYIFQLNKTWS